MVKLALLLALVGCGAPAPEPTDAGSPAPTSIAAPTATAPACDGVMCNGQCCPYPKTCLSAAKPLPECVQ